MELKQYKTLRSESSLNHAFAYCLSIAGILEVGGGFRSQDIHSAMASVRSRLRSR